MSDMAEVLRWSKAHRRWRLEYQPKESPLNHPKWQRIDRYDSLEEAEMQKGRYAAMPEHQGNEFMIVDNLGSL